MSRAGPPHPIRRATGFAIGVDVGGTKIAAGLVEFPVGRLLVRRQCPTNPARGGDAVLAQVRRLVSELEGVAAAEHRSVGALGVGVCELVSPSGEVMSGGTIAWTGVPVAERLAVDVPILIDADVRAAAYAEACYGAGRGEKCFVYLTVGTGISSCLVLDGLPFTGAHGATGTVASGPWRDLGRAGGDAGMQTLEQIASGPAVVARYNLLGTSTTSGAEQVLAAAAGGDVVARDVVHEAGSALGEAVGWLVNVLDPALLVVGGGLGLAGGLYWESLVASTRRHIWSEFQRQLAIVPAETGADAGVIGAAAQAWKRSGGTMQDRTDG